MPKCSLKQFPRMPRPGQHPGGVMGLCPRKRREGDKGLSPEGELKMSFRFLIC